MSFLGDLLKVGGAVAAPFTGGASLALALGAEGAGTLIDGNGAPNVAGASQVAGQAAGAAAQGQATQAGIQQKQDQLKLDQEKQQQQQMLDAIGAQIQQGNYATSQYKQNTSDALHGGLLQGVQDTQISGLPAGVHIPTITGGLRPSALTGASTIGAQLQAHGMNGMANPQTLAAYTPTTLAPLTPLPTPTASQSILSSLGTYGSLASALFPPSTGVPGAAPSAPASTNAAAPMSYPGFSFNGAATASPSSFSFGAPITPAPTVPSGTWLTDDWTKLLAPRQPTIQFGGGNG